MRRIAAPGLLTFALATIAPAAAVVVLPGCGESCNAAAYAGLSVTVLDATGAAICDATVVARDGDYAETLHAWPDGGTCRYSGALERSGTYEVEASSAGLRRSLTNVVVTSDSCHVMTREVTITLPAPAGA